jgi:hypothetical protein
MLGSNVLGAAREVAETYAACVRPSFGPYGLDRFVFTDVNPTGARISNSGDAIIDAIRVQHPVGHLISSSVKLLASTAGDGSTVFIMALAAMLRHADSFVSESANPDARRRKMSLFGDALRKMKSEWMEKLLLPVYSKHVFVLSACHAPIGQLRVFMESLLMTMITPIFGLSVPGPAELLVKLLMFALVDPWLEAQDASRKKGALRSAGSLNQYLTDCGFMGSGLPVLAIAGAPLGSSSVLSGVLLPESKFMAPLQLEGGVKFVVLKCPLGRENSKFDPIRGGSVPCDSDQCPTESADGIFHDAGLIRRMRWLADTLANSSVVLLLCTERVSAKAALLLAQRGVQSVQGISEGDAETICTRARISPVLSIPPHDESSPSMQGQSNIDGHGSALTAWLHNRIHGCNSAATCVGRCGSCRQVTVGGQPCVHMVSFASADGSSAIYIAVPKTIVLRAPSSPVLQLYVRAIRRAVVYLRSAVRERFYPTFGRQATQEYEQMPLPAPSTAPAGTAGHTLADGGTEEVISLIPAGASIQLSLMHQVLERTIGVARGRVYPGAQRPRSGPDDKEIESLFFDLDDAKRDAAAAVLSAVAAALRTVPAQLHSSAACLCRHVPWQRDRDVLEMLRRVGELLDRGCDACVLDCRQLDNEPHNAHFGLLTLRPINMQDIVLGSRGARPCVLPLVEPSGLQWSTLSLALDIAAQIVRIDGIVSIKRKIGSEST